MATAPIGGTIADTLKCGLLAAGLACGPLVVVTAAGPNAPAAGSVLDWVYLVLVSLSFLSFPFALVVLAVAVVDLWRRRPVWQVLVGVLLAVGVIYAWKDFP